MLLVVLDLPPVTWFWEGLSDMARNVAVIIPSMCDVGASQSCFPSKTVTIAPLLAARQAVAQPAGPAPIMKSFTPSIIVLFENTWRSTIIQTDA